MFLIVNLDFNQLFVIYVNFLTTKDFDEYKKSDFFLIKNRFFNRKVWFLNKQTDF